jgi:hypothetical protein
MAVNLLLSYAFHADRKLDQLRADLVCGRLLIDSGAFTAHSTGRPVDLDAYAAYLERWRGCWDYAVTLDVIGDQAATMRNTRILHARGLPVMPVFTPGGSLAEFDAMVADCGYVCVGGLVGLPRPIQLRRVGTLQRRAQERGGGIHALGIGSLDILRAARPWSADASSVSGAFRFGSVIYFDGQRIRSTAATKTDHLARDREWIRAHGIDLAHLARTGRMPHKSERPRLIQAMTLAYAVADELLKRTGPVPAPSGTDDLPGTHLYSSIGADGRDVDATAALDRRLHTDPDVPSIWRRYSTAHTCKGRAPSHA